MNKLRWLLFFIGVIMVISGFVLHFYYGPVKIRYAVIGALMIFVGILLFVILIIMYILYKIKGRLKIIKPKV